MALEGKSARDTAQVVFCELLNQMKAKWVDQYLSLIPWEVQIMNEKWIIEVVDDGRPAFICEHRGELYLTRRRSEAAVYTSELGAKCALVYIADRYQPRMALVQGAVQG
jgi:hypothetical protein